MSLFGKMTGFNVSVWHGADCYASPGITSCEKQGTLLTQLDNVLARKANGKLTLSLSLS